MKTCEEIRDAINAVARAHICDPAMEDVIDILHDMLVRIKMLERDKEGLGEL